MASITPVKNRAGEITSYRISVYCGIKNGKKQHKTKTVKPVNTAPTKLKKELERAALDFENAVLHGTDFSDGNHTRFNDVISNWDKNVLTVRVATGDLTEACREKYLRMIRLYANKELDGMLISQIRPSNIDATIRSMIFKGYSNKTIKNYFNALHQCFEYAVRNDLIENNPCNRASFVPQVRKKHDLHVFSEDQVQRFLFDALEVDIPRSHEWKKQEDKAFFNLALYGGFRKGEILALTWNDINLDAHTVVVSKAVGYSDRDKEFIKAPKTDSGNRTIQIPAICCKVLKEWRTQCLSICMQAGTNWHGCRNDFDNNYVFIRPDGSRMSSKEPYKHFKLILDAYNRNMPKEKKLPEITLHDLRHTCASHLVAAGTDIETVARRLGHSNPSFTLDVYAHALEEKDAGAADTLEQLFTGCR